MPAPRRKRAGHPLVRSHKDRLAKAGLRFCVGHTLAPLGLDLPPIVAEAPTEGLVVRSRIADIVFRLADDTYVDIEQISGDRPADLYHLLGGAAPLAEAHHRPIRVVVLYTGGVRSAPDALDAGAIGFQVRNVFAEDLDGDAILEAALAKVAAGGTLDGEDTMALAFVGVMRHVRRPVAAAVREAVRLAATLPRPGDRQGCAAAVVLLAQPRLSPDEVLDLVEVFRVAAPRMADVLEQIGREKGKAEGKAEAKAEYVLRGLRRRCGEPSGRTAGRILAERDIATLDHWLDLALGCPSLQDFEREAFLH